MTYAEIDNFLRHTLAPSTLGRYETLRATYDTAAALIANGVPGDFVECGVYAGGECAAMALSIKNGQWCEWNRRVHLFDSFQGMPQCGPEDSEFLASGNKPGEACCPLDHVQRNMRNWGIPGELLVYHQGWFADTMRVMMDGDPVANGGPQQIALLRLDADLYESTKICLERLYPRVVKGGALIIDDYPLSGCRKALHEVVGYPQPIQFWKVDE